MQLILLIKKQVNGIKVLKSTYNLYDRLNEFNKTIVKISKPVGGDQSVRFKDLYVSETEMGTTYG